MQTNAERLARLTLEQGQDHALILLDADGRVVGWHMDAPSIFGYARDEMIGRTLHVLFTSEDRERGEPELELEIAKRLGKAEDDRWSLRKDGSRLWANGIMSSLRDESGNIVGYSKVVRDRTDVRSQIESHQNRITALEKANEARNLLLATLAHELRNPLGVMKIATHLLMMTAKQSTGFAEPVKTIERQVRFIQRLVDDLFESARLEQGKVQLALATEPLRPIIERAIETCGELIAESKQQIYVLFPPGEIVVTADPARLQRAFVNLIANACKFSTPNRCIWIKATVEGDEAVIRVEDQGRGIPHEVLPTIFDLFTQATPFEPTTRTGLGLGLALVKSIVELHGGTVQARSEGQDKGSEFIVHLPLRARQALQQPGMPVGSAPGDFTTPP